MAAKARVFVGSSTEGLTVADAIHLNLDRVAEVTPWQHAFESPKTYIESLMLLLDRSDFAVFVLTADDARTIRGQADTVPRDNVIFELGLFIGRLGRERVFIVVPRNTPKLRLPSDLLGVASLDYATDRSDDNLAAALNPACQQIRAAIARWSSPNSAKRSSAKTKQPPAKTKRVAKKTPPAKEPSKPATTAAAAAQYLLLRRKDGRFAVLPYKSVQHGSELTVELLSVAGATTSFLQDLRGTREEIGIAYDLTAEFGRVRSIENRRGELDVWTLSIDLEDRRTYPFSEIALQGISVDDIAELRAKRILLDERLPMGLRTDLVEMSVGNRIGEGLSVAGSPLPAMYREHRKNRPLFLEAARLFSVLLLRSTNTVERIHKLELKLDRSSKLAVDFEGVRAARYSSEPGHRIKFKGTCDLSAPATTD